MKKPNLIHKLYFYNYNKWRLHPHSGKYQEIKELYPHYSTFVSAFIVRAGVCRAEIFAELFK